MSLSSGGKVERSKVNTVLENMGIVLTGEELQSLTDNLPVNGKHCGYFSAFLQSFACECAYENF